MLGHSVRSGFLGEIESPGIGFVQVMDSYISSLVRSIALFSVCEVAGGSPRLRGDLRRRIFSLTLRARLGGEEELVIFCFAYIGSPLLCDAG